MKKILKKTPQIGKMEALLKWGAALRQRAAVWHYREVEDVKKWSSKKNQLQYVHFQERMCVLMSRKISMGISLICGSLLIFPPRISPILTINLGRRPKNLVFVKVSCHHQHILLLDLSYFSPLQIIVSILSIPRGSLKMTNWWFFPALNHYCISDLEMCG